MSDPDWQADLARYPRRPWLKEQSIWAIAVYRFGRRVDRRRPGLWRTVLETVLLAGVPGHRDADRHQHPEVGPGRPRAADLALRQHLRPRRRA